MDSLSFKAISDVGLVRTNNEDSFIAEFVWDRQHVLCAAIDGVGGYEGGEVAAEIARSTLIEFLKQYPDDNLKDVITQAVLQANNNIHEQRKHNSRFPHMSCVISAAIIDIRENRLYIAHVGDSRIYLYDKGNLVKLTHDHSLVGYREEIGELTEEEAMNHPQRNIIERCLGEKQRVFGENNFIESSVFDIPANGKILFCSDGLTDLVTSKEIIQILSRQSSTTDKCTALVDCAKSHGGKDNITVVLVETEQKKVESQEVVVTGGLGDNSDGNGASPDHPSGNPDTADASLSETPRSHRTRSSLLWRIALPIITLIAGFVGGMLLVKRPVEPTVTQQDLSWETVLKWCASQAPTDTTDVWPLAEGDSLMISKDDFLQYRFYEENVRTIIRLKNEAEQQNDSLSTLLSQKDSLLKEAATHFERLLDPSSSQ